LDLRLSLAILSAKLAGKLIRASGRGGGTALPGLVAQRVHPDVVSRVSSRLENGVFLVSGTNGKTTTSRIIAECFVKDGYKVLHNRSGSNLVRGIASSLVDNSRISGMPTAELAVFEVDEASLPGVLSCLTPRSILLTNLFRDQLDRYGEIDTVRKRWVEAISKLPSEVTLIVNADDPSLVSIARQVNCRVIYYGLNDNEVAMHDLPHAADAVFCPDCGGGLLYSSVYVSHMGNYCCLNCGFSRPALDYEARGIQFNGVRSLSFELHHSQSILHLDLPLPGLYNVYNALAACSLVMEADVEASLVEQTIRSFEAAFGRFERVKVGDKQIVLALIKNPVGCNEVLRMFSYDDSTDPILIAINDNFADGRDVSWLWDADFEMLASRNSPFVVSGIRGADMALRLKYAGVDPSNIQLVERLEDALDRSLSLTSSGGELRVMPTYTAMLDLRRIMSSRGWVDPYWED